MKPFDLVKTYWGEAAKVAVFVTALITAFLIKPPSLWVMAPEQPQMLDFTRWVLAILLGLFFLSTTRRKSVRPAAWRWISVGALVAGILFYFLYVQLSLSWTLTYDLKGPTIIGGDFPPEAKAFQRELAFSDEQMIKSVGGRTYEFWPKPVLIQRYMIFCALYAATMISLSVAAMAMVEFLRSRLKLSPPEPEKPAEAT